MALALVVSGAHLRVYPSHCQGIRCFLSRRAERSLLATFAAIYDSFFLQRGVEHNPGVSLRRLVILLFEVTKSTWSNVPHHNFFREFRLCTTTGLQARLWDIRRSGASACLISLDQHQEEEEEEEEEEEDDHTVRGAGGGSSEEGSDVDSGRSSSKKRSRGYLKHLKLA